MASRHYPRSGQPPLQQWSCPSCREKNTRPHDDPRGCEHCGAGRRPEIVGAPPVPREAATRAVETAEEAWESIDETLAKIVEPRPITMPEAPETVTVYRLIRYVGLPEAVRATLDLSLTGEHDEGGGLKMAAVVLGGSPSIDQLQILTRQAQEPTVWRARKIEPPPAPAPAAAPSASVDPLRLWVEVGVEEEEPLPIDQATLLVQALSHYADFFDNAHALRLAERISLGHLPQGDQ